jgi:hypothetical protein
MTRKIDYLFLRNGSRNWHIKLQYPGGERVEKSLGTPDRAQAEILASPYIQDHKVRLLEARPGIQVTWLHRFAPGQEHITPDGERVVADERELIFLNDNGAIVRKEPNGEFAVALPPLREQKAIVRREEQGLASMRGDGSQLLFGGRPAAFSPIRPTTIPAFRLDRGELPHPKGCQPTQLHRCC